MFHDNQFYFFHKVWHRLASSNFADILYPLSLSLWVVGVTSAPKEEVKRLPGGKIKKKVRALKIFVPFDAVFMQPGLHENSNVI
jgi:hypothetical protein